MLQVTFGLTVATQQFEQGPLKWKGLKLTGFTGKVRVFVIRKCVADHVRNKVATQVDVRLQTHPE